MDSRYPLVAMESFLTQRKEFFRIDDDTEYDLVTVQLHGRGIRHREQKFGREIKTKRQQMVRVGELLVAEIDAKAGGYGLVPPEAAGSIVSSHYYLYEIDEQTVEPRFLEYYLKSGQPEFDIQQFVQGSLNYAAIRPYQFPQLEIPLPPLEEQRRIVARLDGLTARIEQALALQEAAIEETEAFLSASLQTVFGGSDAEDWSMTTLEEVADIRAGVTLGRKLRTETISVPYLRVANVQDGYLDLSEVKEVEIRPNELEKWQLQKDDLVLTEGGDFDKLGRGTIWNNELPVCIHQNHIFRVRVDPSLILPEFLELEIRSPYGKEYFLSKAKRTTNLASINQTQLRAFPVRFPGLERQRAIIAKLRELQDKTAQLRKMQEESASALAAMQPAALDKAFRGEL